MKELNLYLLKREADYDEYDGFVIATDSEESARGMAKGDGTNGYNDDNEGTSWYDSEAMCILIGTTKPTKHSIILSSYKAG